MKILVTGASGLIGSALVEFWRAHGEQVGRIVREREVREPDELSWQFERGIVEPAQWEGWDALVHLAGEPVMQRGTAKNRARIRESRVEATRRLCRGLTALRRPPPLLLSASAVGYYGDRGDAWLTESSGRGEGFLAEVCGEWEKAAAELSERGARVLLLRFGLVLSAQGGALCKMLPLFRWGLGGRIGSGRQYVSWIALDDLVRGVDFALRQPGWSGPFNLVSPHPLPQGEFAAVLGRLLHRPAWLPLPALAVQLLLGEPGCELLLGSQRVLPARLQEAGFRFDAPDLESALRRELMRI